MPKTVTTVDMEGNTTVVALDELRWRPSAYAIVIKDNALLVSPQTNGYDLPGGGIKMGEMPEEAVIREVKEETGIIVNNPRIVDSSSSFFTLPASSKGRHVQSILLYFVCDFVSGELSDSGFTEDEKVLAKFPEWLPLEEFESRLTDENLGSSNDWRPLIRKIVDSSIGK